MAKAALEAMNGFNLYGDKGSSWSVVYVDVDAHNRNRTTFDTLLPRESASKVSKNFRFDFENFRCFFFSVFLEHRRGTSDDRRLANVCDSRRRVSRRHHSKMYSKITRNSRFLKRFLRDGQYTDLETKGSTIFITKRKSK